MIKVVLCTIVLSAALFSVKAQSRFLLFSYFQQERRGANLALSTDGIHWKPLNKGKVVIKPEVGERLMRDPSINLGKDGIYRMVWTTGWKGKEIGYAESTDLLHWTGQRALPVGAHIDSTNNCWAPEIFYDDSMRRYQIFWSSQVGEWRKPGSEGRIYYVTTDDFIHFSEPGILFRNGYTAGGDPGNDGPIDAYILKDDRRYVLFYKKDDNSRVPNLFYRVSNAAEGPWGEEVGPVLPSTGDEGPSCLRVDGEYWLFTDPFDSDSAYFFSSKDMIHWQRRTTDLRMSHGTVITVSPETARRLLGSERN